MSAEISEVEKTDRRKRITQGLLFAPSFVMVILLPVLLICRLFELAIDYKRRHENGKSSKKL